MKHFIFVLLGTFGLLCTTYITFVAIIDPFYVFHMPLGQLKPIPTNNSHYVARGLIRNMEYDMLICGSSMCENMHVNTANDIWDVDSLKVVQYGSYSNDLRASLEAAAESGKAETIIMALDTAVFQKPDEGYRNHDFPDYAIEKPTLFNIWSYILNKDTLKYSVDLIKMNRENSVPDQNNWHIVSGDFYSEESVLESYKSTVTENGYNEMNIRDFNVLKAWNNLRNIEKGVQACEEKGIVIKFFIPPYSIANWDFRDHQLEVSTYKDLWKELIKYSNVELYAIQFDKEMIVDFNNYRNLGHYSEAVCDEILYDIRDGKFKLDLDNIDENVDEFLQFLCEYDWGTLRRKAGV